MIYAASYYAPQTHHGVLLSGSLMIPRKLPKGVMVTQRLACIAPPWDLLRDWLEWKQLAKDEQRLFPDPSEIAAYSDRYWEHINQRNIKGEILHHLETRNPKQDETVLCYEPAGDFCHRNLYLKIVKKYRPDCYGGADIPVRGVLCN